jgi:photosystem II stability/assembly factor-like uncharacterized protein
VKNKSIGSLVVLALLAPSCGGGSGGGGGGGSAPPLPQVLARWQTQQRVPTSSDLRSVVFANASQGIIAGKDGTFFRTDNGGANWTQLEITPSNLGSNNTAMSANGITLVAVGTDLASGLCRSYNGVNSSGFTTDPNPIPAGLGFGLVGEYYNDLYQRSLNNTNVNEGPIDFTWAAGPGGGVNSFPFSVRWRGMIETPTVATELFTFTATTIAADTVRLEINGASVFTGVGPTQTGTFSMAPGNRYSFVLEFQHPAAAATSIRLQWSSPSTPLADVPKTRLYTGAPYTDVNASMSGSPGIYWMLRNDGTIDYNYSGLIASFSTLDLTPPPPPAGVPPSQPIDWQEANGILFIGNSGYGLVCGRDNGWAGYPAGGGYPANPGHAAQGQVIRTSNNGGSWSVQSIIPTTTKTFRRMWLTNSKYGAYHAYMVGDDNNGHGILLATDPLVPDYWNSVGGAGAPATAPSFRALCFPSDQYGYIVGDGGTIYRVSDDGGVVNTGPPPTLTYTYTWTAMSSGTTENLYGVYFVDNDHGYAVGDQGTVLKISNASTGTTWTKMTSGTPAIAFNAASFTDDGVKGIAVGNGGAIFRTTDGGLTWSPMTSPTAQNLLGASVPPGGAGTYAFACGANNTLLRNSDVWGLGSWAQAGTITGAVGSETYQAVLFPKTEANGVCVGAKSGSGVVLRTSGSAGDSWAAVTPGSPPAGSYYSLLLNPTGSALYASGSAGMIATSTDVANGWTTWSSNIPVPVFPSALTLSSIASPEGATFQRFVAASDGKVWRETSGVAPVWAATAAPWNTAVPQELAFQAELNGVVLTDTAGMFSTINGGATWEPSPIHSMDKPRGLWMSRTVPGLGYVVADNGTIFKTVSSGR